MDTEPAPTRPLDGTDAAFRVSALGSATLSPDQVRGRQLVAPSRGVRFRADCEDRDLARQTAAALMAPDGAVLCDVTAAARWGLPLPAWIGLAADVQIGIAVASGSGRPQRTGVRGRRLRLPSQHLTSRDGLFLTVPARTWVDCAEHLPVEHLVAMGDAILRRGLAAPSDLDAMVRWARGRRGVSSARRALPILDQGAESPGESWVRAVLVLAGLPRPQCNVDVYAESTWLARADLVWRSSRLIVEYDGIVHLREEQRRRDALRRNLLQDRGWTVIVFTAADLRRPERMVSLVRSALLGRTNVGRVVGYRGGIAD